MDAQQAFDALARESVDRVSKLVQGELETLSGLLAGGTAATDLPQQRRLLNEHTSRVALAYSEAVKAISNPSPLLQEDAAGLPSAGAPAQSLAQGNSSSYAKGGSAIQGEEGGNGAAAVGDAVRQSLSTPDGGASLSGRLPHVLAAATDGSVVSTAPGADSTQRPSDSAATQRTSGSSGWGSQYLPGVSSSSLLAGMAAYNTTNNFNNSGALPPQPSGSGTSGLTGQGILVLGHQEGHRVDHSGPLAQLPASASALVGGVGSGSSATAGQLQQQQVAPGSGSSLTGPNGASAAAYEDLRQQQQHHQVAGLLEQQQQQLQMASMGLLRVGGQANSSGSGAGAARPTLGSGGVQLAGLPQRTANSALAQQHAEAEDLLLRRLQQADPSQAQQQPQQQQQQPQRMSLPSSSASGSLLAQQHQSQHQSLLQQLLQQQQQQPALAERQQGGLVQLEGLPGLSGAGDALSGMPGSGGNLASLQAQLQQQQNGAGSQQHSQAISYQVDPATGNVVAVVAQDMYGSQQQQQQQGLVLDGTLVLDAGSADLLQQQQQQQGQFLSDPALSSLLADAAASGNLPMYVNGGGSSQQQLSATLLALQQQQQQQQQQGSAASLGSLAGLQRGGAGATANSEPLPVLVSIPTAQGGTMLAFAAPNGAHGHSATALHTVQGTAELQQQLGLPPGHQLALAPGGGLTLAPAGGATSLLQAQQQVQHRLAGTLAAPSAGAGATLVTMPGGGLGVLAPQQLAAFGPGGALQAVQVSALGVLGAATLPTTTAEMPGRFKVLPLSVQQRILTLCRANPVITIRDFDDKVVSKLSLLVDSWGIEQALAMLDHLEYRMRTKQGAMKNGPGYLDVAVCSHLDMLKAQGACPKSMKLDEYAQQVLAPSVFHELCEAVSGNRWLAWEHFDQGIIQLLKRLPPESAVEKLQEITFHSFKNVDNVKGCIMSILNSKIREDRRRP